MYLYGGIKELESKRCFIYIGSETGLVAEGEALDEMEECSLGETEWLFSL